MRRTALVVVACVLALAGCSSDPQDTPSSPGEGARGPAGDGGTTADGVSDDEDAAPPKISVNVRRGAADVPVSTLLEVGATGGPLSTVTVSSEAGEVPGQLADDGAAWTASERLEPGTAYVLRAVAGSGDATARTKLRFTTQALTLDQQTYPSVSPVAGDTVGVGMPVIVNFDLPVSDRAEFERHMVVTSSPEQAGAWHWLSGNVAHWRPKSYWRPGTEVDVDIDVNGLDAGSGIYGQEDRHVEFEIGDAHIYQVDAATHQMKVFSNGKLLRKIPITTGKAGFTTRSGIKVIVEKFASRRMNSETVGIPAGSAEAYDIDDVQWAMRLTYSGEFIHAAPWSVGSQGYENVSHGCTGMNDENAYWLYNLSLVGDVVEYTGTDRPMTFDNGYGDWNVSFKEFQKGSALA